MFQTRQFVYSHPTNTFACQLVLAQLSRGLHFTLDCSLPWSKGNDQITGSHPSRSRLNRPCGLYVHGISTIYVADSKNHRIVACSPDARDGRLIAGGRGRGEALDQLDTPTNVVVDQRTNRLIICDTGNRRIVSYSFEGDAQTVLVGDVSCEGLAVDEHGYLYFSDSERCEVRRMALDHPFETTLVAGGHGYGSNMDQLSYPTCLFVDREGVLYIADSGNHRVMRWSLDDTNGTIVAGDNGEGDDLNQLCYPNGIVVDNMGTVYVADTCNNRIMVWERDTREGVVLNGAADRLSTPHGLSFDQQGNLYATEWKHGRITKYTVLQQ